MVTEDPMNPENPNRSPRKQPENGGKWDPIFSPRFKSIAAIAGWDEESLLNASLVDDTPDRDSKHKRRSDSQFKTPPTNSRRKRRAQRKSPVSIPVVVLNLDDDETSKEESLQNKEEGKIVENGELNKPAAAAADSCPSSSIPCMDKLQEELSCAICLEICYEPSTTTCGHSFCKKCLRSAADKCGKRCPKCRQFISNGRSCKVNTVLWNTIQLLFPQEVEARKAASGPRRSPPVRLSRSRNIQALNSPEGEGLNLERRRSNQGFRNRNIQALNSPEGEGLNLERRRSNHGLRNQSVRPTMLTRRRTRDPPSQDKDAALAMRLQREEIMGPAEEQQQQQRGSSIVLASESLRAAEERQEEEEHPRRSSVTFVNANLRAMALRAVNIRLRSRAT